LPIWRVAPEERTIAPADEDDGVARFREITHFETLMRAAIEDSGVALPADPTILVLRAGIGVNAVAPCLRLFRGARIVATDRTDEHFPLLRQRLRDSGASDRVVCLEIEPESETLPGESFDLVAGATILNRLFDPDAALANVFRVLKPGGHAVFMEPFDGFGLIRLAFERICAEGALRGDLTPPLREAMSAAALDIGARTMPDRSAPGFEKLEQKWLFSRESLAAGARQIGFREVRFFPHNDHQTLYRDFARNLIAEAVGAGALADMPEWAWRALDEFDRALPPPVKRLLMLEGTIVLSK
jgi:SAM-dependent methyltransferase